MPDTNPTVPDSQLKMPDTKETVPDTEQKVPDTPHPLRTLTPAESAFSLLFKLCLIYGII
ncbi:hypothetical protein [Phascolarctobacterium succinatutens]|uniref:hypothetical protein n=1 Tax=Phascolarctobacterium succinatutens TaxID=626940 RepID=UPI003AB5DD6E